MENQFIQISKANNKNQLRFGQNVYNVQNLILQAIVYSPYYDIVIYFCDDSLLSGEFCFNIKITISDAEKRTKTFNSTCKFSKSQSFSRFSGLLDQYPNEMELSIKIEFYLTKSHLNSSIYLFDRQQKFNLIKMDDIKGDSIYNSETRILNLQDIQKYKADFDMKSYKFFVAFPDTFELFGPINIQNFPNYIIYSKTKFVSLFQIPKHLAESNCLGFFVENNSKNQKEFFGVYNLSEIPSNRMFQSEYTNFTVNDQLYDSKRNYNSGTIIVADHKDKVKW